MDAKRELDALVAERVMGWANVGCESNSMHTEFVPHGKPPFPVTIYSGRLELPRFSTDISAAMEIVLTFAPKIAGRISMDVTGKDAACGIGFSEDIQPYVRAKTLPLAICLAFLKAMDEWAKQFDPPTSGKAFFLADPTVGEE